MTPQPTSLFITRRVFFTDIAVLAAVYGIPALSHIAPFPLYYLDPMRLLLLTGYLLTRHQGNAILLSLSIPLFSSFFTGHPPLAKATLIAMELLVNISLLHFVLERWKQSVLLAVFGSIVISKCVYYIAKALFIQFGWLADKLIATDLYTQVLSAGAIAFAFSLFYRRKG
jgi:hypothetical protein